MIRQPVSPDSDAISIMRSIPAEWNSMTVCIRSSAASRKRGSAPLRICAISPSIFCMRFLSSLSMDLLCQTEHGRMVRLQNPAAPNVHMYTARQARVETAHGPHDVDTFAFVRTVFFEDGRNLHGILVRPRSAVDIPGTRIPRRWRIRVIVLDLAFLDYDVMGKHSAYGLV